MTLILDLTPETERILRREAEARGLPNEQYAMHLIELGLPAGDISTPILSRTDLAPEQRLAMLDNWLNQPRPAMPDLPDEALERDSLYDDR